MKTSEKIVYLAAKGSKTPMLISLNDYLTGAKDLSVMKENDVDENMYEEELDRLHWKCTSRKSIQHIMKLAIHNIVYERM